MGKEWGPGRARPSPRTGPLGWSEPSGWAEPDATSMVALDMNPPCLVCNAVPPSTTLSPRPPVSRAAPQPEKLQKNNVTKKKKLLEVRKFG